MLNVHVYWCLVPADLESLKQMSIDRVMPESSLSITALSLDISIIHPGRQVIANFAKKLKKPSKLDTYPTTLQFYFCISWPNCWPFPYRILPISFKICIVCLKQVVSCSSQLSHVQTARSVSSLMYVYQLNRLQTSTVESSAISFS